MQRTLILLALLPLAFGASLLNYLPASQGKPISMNQDREPCCSPDQFEGLVSGLVGIAVDGGQIIIDTMNYSYDGTNKRTNMVGTTRPADGPERSFRVLARFDQNRQYMVDSEGKCTYTEAGEFIPTCIPDNATYVGRFRHGMGAESYEDDLWRFQMQGYTVLLITTPNNCVIVSQTAYGDYQPNVGVISAFGLVNPTAGIRDPAVFDPPSDCQPAANPKPQNKMAFGL